MMFSLLDVTEKKKRRDILDLFNEFYADMINITAAKLKQAGDTNYSDDAQDVVQNVFLRITQYEHRLWMVKDKNLKAYLYVMVTNETINFLSSLVKTGASEEIKENSIVDDGFVDALVERDRLDELTAKILQLDEKYGVVMFLKIAKGYSAKKIARQLNITEAAVYSRLKTGRKKLMELLGEDPDSEET